MRPRAWSANRSISQRRSRPLRQAPARRRAWSLSFTRQPAIRSTPFRSTASELLSPRRPKPDSWHARHYCHLQWRQTPISLRASGTLSQDVEPDGSSATAVTSSVNPKRRRSIGHLHSHRNLRPPGQGTPTGQVTFVGTTTGDNARHRDSRIATGKPLFPISNLSVETHTGMVRIMPATARSSPAPARSTKWSTRSALLPPLSFLPRTPPWSVSPLR